MSIITTETTPHREPLTAAERAWMARSYSTCADWCTADHDAGVSLDPEHAPVEHSREIGQVGDLYVAVVQSVGLDSSSVGIQVQQDVIGRSKPIATEDVPALLAGLIDLLNKAQTIVDQIDGTKD